MLKNKTVLRILAVGTLVFALYGYAYANSVVIILGDDFFVIPFGPGASPPVSLSYEYDALGRLVEVETGEGTRQTFGLDAVGNRTIIQIF